MAATPKLYLQWLTDVASLRWKANRQPLRVWYLRYCTWGGTVELPRHFKREDYGTGGGKETVQDAIGTIRVRVRGLGAVVRQNFQHAKLLQSQHEGFVVTR